MTNKKLLILKDEIKINDKYEYMYTVDIFGEMNEYENVRFISTQGENINRIYFAYNEDGKGYTFISENTKAYVSKLEALRVSSSILAEIYTDALHLYLEEKAKANG